MSLTFNTKVKLKINNKPWKRIQTNLKRGGNQIIRVGFFDGRYPSGISVPMVAAWNEEGHMTGWGNYSPPRPFIRVGFMKEIRQRKWLIKYLPYVERIAKGTMTWKTLNQLIAKEFVDIMKKHILDWDTPPNSALTIKLKGFNDPLINTGRMYDRVKAKVVRKGL
jgi:hypothetical protein